MASTSQGFQAAPHSDAELVTRGFWRDPLKMAGVFLVICLFLLFILLLLLFVCLSVEGAGIIIGSVVTMLIVSVLEVISFCLLVQLLKAKHRAIEYKDRPVPLFWGFAQLIVWEQNHGVIILRDKRVQALIYGPSVGGGMTIIYMILGEELRKRVSLTLNLSQFKDDRILTREAIQLSVRVAVWWKISDLAKFYFLLNKEIHVLTDTGRHLPGFDTSANPDRAKQESAEAWVLTLTESCLRQMISETSTALIVSKRASTHLHVGKDSQPNPGLPMFRSASGQPTPATPDVIASNLTSMLRDKVKDYGLEIDRVEVQEVLLPQAIQQAVDNVWVSSTKPAQAEFESRARQLDLQRIAEVIGVEATAVKEIMKSTEGSMFMGNPLEVLGEMFGKMNKGALPNKSQSVPVLQPAQPIPQAQPAPQFHCPSCGVLLRLPSSLAVSAQIVCPTCKQIISNPSFTPSG